MNSPRYILASASPRRKDILSEILDHFEVMPSRAEEIITGGKPPGEIARGNAHAKAVDIGREFPDAVVIGADTIVILDGTILGKPSDLEDAVRMLGLLSGRTHRVITGVAVVNLAHGIELVKDDVSEVRFRELDRARIERYVSECKPLDKAGAYGIQELGEDFVETVDGSYENVIGLPAELTARMLSEMRERLSKIN